MQRCTAVLVGLVDGRPLSHQQFQTGLALQKDSKKDGWSTFISIFRTRIWYIIQKRIVCFSVSDPDPQ
jgi:hypothetical protein